MQCLVLCVCCQVGYLLLIAVMLVSRTYADVWMIQNGTAIEGWALYSTPLPSLLSLPPLRPITTSILTHYTILCSSTRSIIGRNMDSFLNNLSKFVCAMPIVSNTTSVCMYLCMSGVICMIVQYNLCNFKKINSCVSLSSDCSHKQPSQGT